MEYPLDRILVIRSSEHLLDDELTCSGDNRRLITEVCVLEQDASILFVNADGILDGANTAFPGRELGIKIMDGTLTVTS